MRPSVSECLFRSKCPTIFAIALYCGMVVCLPSGPFSYEPLSSYPTGWNTVRYSLNPITSFSGNHLGSYFEPSKYLTSETSHHYLLRLWLRRSGFMSLLVFILIVNGRNVFRWFEFPTLFRIVGSGLTGFAFSHLCHP